MTNLVQFPGLGLSFEINRVALSIGGFNIYWYGVCIAFGICLALVFAFRHSIEFGVDPDSMVDVILIGIVLGIVSARAYYVAMAPFKYESIWEMIAIRDGGLAIYGGIIGGFLFGGLACKRRGVPVLPMFDLTAMGFLLGQGCGRWGNFFGMLPSGMADSRLYGVELDSITGRIAQKLYPQADITVAGFETTDRRDFYDLAVGNVPFGQYKVNDKAYNKLGFSIHNYFFAKTIDQIRPGGVIAFVTSRFTMDSKDSSARKYMAERADLLGAIRLPNNAFKANASTEVVSDHNKADYSADCFAAAEVLHILLVHENA